MKNKENSGGKSYITALHFTKLKNLKNFSTTMKASWLEKVRYLKNKDACYMTDLRQVVSEEGHDPAEDTRS